MSETTLQMLLGALKDLSFKKVLLVVLTICLVLTCLVGYERVTASLRLNRLEKETDLLSKLQEFQKQAGTNMTPQLIQAQSLVHTQTIQIFKEEPASYESVVSYFWPLLRILFYVAILFVVGGILMLLFFVIFVFVTNFKVARDKSRTNACINNLRQIDAAKNQWGLDNSKSLGAIPTEQDLKKYLKRGEFPSCPSGDSYKINPLGENPTCIASKHKLDGYPLDESKISNYDDANPLPNGIVKLLRAILAASDKASSVNCVNNLKQFGLAARIWAGDHNGVFPADISSMKRELHSEKIAHCYGNETAKYIILSPGISSSDPRVVYAKCPIHNHVVLADGSVHDLGSRQLVQKEGKWLVE